MAAVWASALGSALVAVTLVVPAHSPAGPAESAVVQAGSLPYSLPAAGRAEPGRAAADIAEPA